MNQDGFGVNIHKLFGDYGGRHVVAATGKIIDSVGLIGDDRISIRFVDGTGIEFLDDGQSCCEHRYMVCDDDLAAFVGAKFLGAQIKTAPSQDEGYNTPEIQFLELLTDRGPISVANHNEHNGYYGGFALSCRELVTP